MHEAALLCKDAQSALFGPWHGCRHFLRGRAQAQARSVTCMPSLRRRRDEARPHCPDRPGLPVIAVATKSATYDKTVSNLMEVRRGAITVVATEGDEEIEQDCRLHHSRAGRPRRVQPHHGERPAAAAAREAAIRAAATSTSPATWQRALPWSSWFRYFW